MGYKQAPFWIAVLSREANSKWQNLFTCIKMAEKALRYTCYTLTSYPKNIEELV